MMAKAIPGLCPACHGQMEVSQLKCPACGTTVEGQFLLDPFARLTEEQQRFCLLFLRCRGSLKEVGAALGISYPTARNRLDDLIAAMGLAEAPRADFRMQVLEALSRGEITAQEALDQLKGDDEP